MLTLGIGASTAIFSVVDAVVLRGLPFDDAERLVALGERGGGKGSGGGPVGMPGTPGLFDIGDPHAIARVQPQNYLDWVAQQRVFESIAAVDGPVELTLNSAGSEPTDLVGDSGA